MAFTRSYQYVADFHCLQAECPDTCCSGWSMASDARQRARFAQVDPALLESLDEEGMFKQHPESGDCVHLQGGRCGIQVQHGEAMLGDSCHFYPRTPRLLSDETRVAGVLSCPETLRLLLTLPQPFALVETVADPRIGERPDRAGTARYDAAVVDFFVAQAAEPVPAINILRRLLGCAAHTPLPIDAAVWVAAAEALPAGRVQPTNPQMLLYTLALLMATSPKQVRPRLELTFATMAQALHCRMDWDTRVIHPATDSAAAYVAQRVRWQAQAAQAMEPAMRRWIQAQLAVAAFPYGGMFAGDVAEGVQFLCVRFALLRLALMCHIGAQGEAPDEATLIRVIQSLSRLVDHTGDHALMRNICRDAGWSDMAGIVGLLDS